MKPQANLLKKYSSDNRILFDSDNRINYVDLDNVEEPITNYNYRKGNLEVNNIIDSNREGSQRSSK